jgi:trehalose 6-phosphate phosphatase
MRARNAILEIAAQLDSARVVGGQQVVNIVPIAAANKGEALLQIRSRLGLTSAIYVGDDDTDEDVFRLASSAQVLGVRVGLESDTAATLFMPDQTTIDAWLRVLVEMRSHASPSSD